MNYLIPLIDGDIVVYQIGWKAENLYWTLPGDKYMKFKYKKDAVKFCGEELEAIEWAEDLVQLAAPESLENTLTQVDHFILSLLETLTPYQDRVVYRIFLSGGDNFRNNVAYTVPYKGHRKDKKKPIYYEEIREHLIKWWNAIEVSGVEADDALGAIQRCSKSKTVICTIDKDLRQIEGWHYNWRRGNLEFVSHEEGMRNFYLQMLMGDSSDNIKGIPGIGPKKAGVILDKAGTLGLAGTTREERWEAGVIKAYQKAFGNDAGELRDASKILNWSSEDVLKNGFGRLGENQALLWILRSQSRMKELCSNWDEEWLV